MNYSERFLVKPGTKAHLAAVDAAFTDKHVSKKEALARTEKNNARLRELQELLYAEHARALLICLQAIDSGGKDGTIRHVMAAMNPQGCRVACFKQPTSLEADHDFLWRAHRAAPAIGEVMVSTARITRMCWRRAFISWCQNPSGRPATSRSTSLKTR